MRTHWSSCPVICACAWLLAVVSADPAPAAPATAPATAPAGDKAPADKGTSDGFQPTTEEAHSRPAADLGKPKVNAIDRITTYYISMYDKPLRKKDWLTRAMAVVSLSRIDDPRITQRMFEIMAAGKATMSDEESAKARQQWAKDAAALASSGTILHRDESTGGGTTRGDDLVRVFCWEALNARYDSLTADQRKRWKQQAVALVKSNCLPGDLKVDVVRLLAAEGPTEDNLALFSHLFANTNSLDPYDIRTLEAMRDVVARWRHPELVKALITAMGQIDDAYRAEFLLGGLGAGVGDAHTLKKKGSKVMWSQTQTAWAAWFKTANLKASDSKTPYTGNDVLPRGEKITDANDPKWRRDLEIEKFRLDPMDVAFVVDSTGSMGEAVAWVKADVLKMMRAFGLVSLEPRIGVTFYRDHGDAYVTKVTELTDDAVRLARRIQSEGADGGGDIPEAVFEGLRETFAKMGWSSTDGVRKVVVVIGDAPPHENTMQGIEALVAAAAKSGARFYCLKVKTRKGGNDLSSFDHIAQWGKGKSFYADFEKIPGPGSTETAKAVDHENPDHQIFVEVINGIVPEAYHDRVGPFVNVLSQYVQTPTREKRQPFDDEKTIKAREAAARAHHGGGGGGGNPRAQ